MAGDVIVFFPKYSSFAGATAPGTIYYSDPFDVTQWKSVAAETMFAGASGSPTISAIMEQSSDLLKWSDFSTAMAPGVTESALRTASDPARYIRLKLTVVGASTVAVVWAKAVCRDA
jgi:hypothetical protein